MCIIIDANVGHEFKPLSAAARLVYEWVQRSGIIAVGGRVKEELLRSGFRDIYHVLLLAGRIYQYRDGDIAREAARLENGGDLESDDPHVLALATISLCRLLFSRDQRLHRDFCNPVILQPRGHVYQDAAHAHLLRAARPCRRPQ